jgi:hypothetical protein
MYEMYTTLVIIPSIICDVLNGQVRAFVDIILKILMGELSKKLLQEALEALSFLFQEKHVDMYHSTARNIIKQLSFSSRQGRSGLPLSPSSSSSFSQTQMLSQNHPLAEVCSTQPSTGQSLANNEGNANNKRGYKMMSNINIKQESPNRAVKPKPQKDIFSELKNINIEKMKSKGGSDVVSNTQQERVKKARLDCIICKSPPTNPFINECGHICCEECWYVDVIVI